MSMADNATSNLTLRGIPARVRATLMARAKARHQSLNAYLIDVLTRDADTPTMSEVLADVDAIRRPTGLTGDDAVAAVREARDTRSGTWA
jgi:antitoxin FitA